MTRISTTVFEFVIENERGHLIKVNSFHVVDYAIERGGVVKYNYGLN